MSRVLAKGTFSSESSSTCTGEKIHLPMLKEFNSIISTNFVLDYTPTSQIVLDVESLGIDWLPGEQYSFVLSPGFCSDRDTEEPNLEISIPYTSNTSPIVESTVPESGSTNIINNRSVALVFSRKVTLQTGFIKLYEDSPTPVLLHTFDVTNPSEVTLVDNILTINVLGYLKSNTKYYILVDGSIVKDADGLFSNSVTSPNSITYTTAPYELFPELKASFATQALSISIGKIVSYADRFLSPPDYDFNYLEDMTNYLMGAPRIVDPQYDGSGTYTLKLTPSNVNAIESWGSINAYPDGGLYSWNSTDKVLTISGTRSQVNTTMDGLYFIGGTDFASDFTITFFAKTPRNDTATKVQNIRITTPYDTEITNMIGVSRNYIGNKENAIFSSNTPYISDFDTTPGLTYTIKFLAGSAGEFSILSDNSDITSTWTFTGTRSECNSKFASLKFWPTIGQSSDTSFTYQQYKNGVLQVSITINLLGSGTLDNFAETLTFTSSSIWTPTVQQAKYGKFDAIIVGGGGGGAGGTSGTGAGGGGGAGEFKVLTNQTFTITPQAITVGTGGNKNTATWGTLYYGTHYYANGTAGTSSSFFGVTASGGSGGVRSWYGTSGSNIVELFTGGSNTSYHGVEATPINITLSGTDNTFKHIGQVAGGGGGGASNASLATITYYSGSTNQQSVGTSIPGSGVTSSISGTAVTYSVGGGGGWRKNDELNYYSWNYQGAAGSYSTTYGSGGAGGSTEDTTDTAGTGLIEHPATNGQQGVVIIKVMPR